jgi:hypothetical protein
VFDISSTNVLSVSVKQLFSHIASDAILKPLGHFAETPNANSYPPICAGDYVEQELSVINLKGKDGL